MGNFGNGNWETVWRNLLDCRMRLTRLILLLILAAPTLQAQRKRSPALQQRVSRMAPAENRVFWIVTHRPDSLKKLFQQVEERPNGLLVVRSNWRFIDSLQAASPLVRFVDIPRRPIEEMALTSFDNSLNTIHQVHHAFPALTGKGFTVSVKENTPDSTDIDFRGRWLGTGLESPTLSQHATIMATIIAGGGNSFYTGRGAAPGARISASDFSSLLPDAGANYQRYGITVQNHSYGTGIENYYGADAAAYDASVYNNPPLLHVFSAGNSGNATSTSGPYAGVPQMANITGSFKMAKNILTVAATDSFGQVSPLSSRGPAYDGRIKPELVAFGQDGSSGAAALTAGAALLLQQAYKEQHGELPDAALVKALLINSAGETGAPGPDFESGFGRLDAFKALQGLMAGHYVEGAGALTLPVAAGMRRLKVTLCWTDPPAAANAARALVNDLDLEVVKGAGVWRPWVLHTQPVVDSLLAPAVRGRDSINNVEQVTIDDPSPGNYTLRVTGSGAQRFFVAWQVDTADRFAWEYPLGNSALTGGVQNIIRWSSTYTAAGLLQFSIDKGLSWQTIEPAVAPGTGQFYWAVPDTFCTGLLRMTINGQSFVSDTFSISSPLSLQVGFHCGDSAMLLWPRVPDVTAYTVYRLGDTCLQPVATVHDTSFVIRDSNRWYTVAPVLNGLKEGIRSYTIDYSDQGVGCYLKSFLALLDNDKAILDITIGTYSNIKSITAEKLLDGRWQPLQIIQPVSSLQFRLTDPTLHHSANTYRITITLNNGATIHSDPQTIHYFLDHRYIFFPNPASPGGTLQVLSQETSHTQLILYNLSGQKVLEKRLLSTTENIPLKGLQRGMYFILIVKKGKKDFTGRLLLQ